MSEDTPAKPNSPKFFLAKKRNLVIVACVAVVLLLVILVSQLAKPQRSVYAYCKVYNEEKARLAKLPGDTWPTGVFNDEVGDASEIARSLSALEKVAPDDVRYDVKALADIYQKMHDEPSQAISASLSGISAEDSAETWTDKNCQDR